MKNLGEVLLNPARIRIIQHLSAMESATVGQLAELMKDIPRTTLYRHINTLYDSGLLIVVQEEKIRGTYEREYALSMSTLLDGCASQEQIEKNVHISIIRLLTNFTDYFQKKDANPIKDRLFISDNVLLLSDDEFNSFIEDVFDVVKRYVNFERNGYRIPRNITLISSPTVERGGFYEE